MQRSIFRGFAVTLGLLGTTAAPAQEESHPAAAFRKADQPALALADGTIVAEAEEFQPSNGSWRARPWGENYYAATLANTFLSRQAYLGAPAQCEESSATIQVRVADTGRYLALVRYEAAYRFQTQFRLAIEQDGKTLLDREYGARRNPKIWAFGQGIKPEVAWTWGAVENIVWEGHDAYVDLQPGLATLSLVVGKQPEPAAKRNIDLVLLTRDEEGVKQRIEKERYLPLDGLLTQEGDVYLKLHNRGQAKTTLSVPAGREHSPYWVHLRTWKPRVLEAQPGETTHWLEVGGVLDTLNDGQWKLTAKAEGDAALDYTVEVGATDATGAIQPIATFDSKSATLELAYEGDTRYSRRIRRTDEVLYELLDWLKQQPGEGPLPKRTPIFGYTFDPRPDDPKYTAAREEFLGLFNLATRDLSNPGTGENPRGYIDVRSLRSPEQLEEALKKYQDEGVAEKIAVVSLGDEIGLPKPPANDHEGFRAWLKDAGLGPGDVAPGAENWEQVEYSPQADRTESPRLFYYSRKYQFAYGAKALKQRTDRIRRYLPNAGVGANFSPHHGHMYLGETHKWVTLFRRGGMTMPWSEDYIWQPPVGTQQMNFLNVDLFRAAIRGNPDAKIYYYVMPHYPGNTPEAWRRQFYGDLAHGVQWFDLFEFRPVQAAYTENYVNLPETYQQVRTAAHELAKFEDIVQDGRVRGSLAALWFSETADVWEDNADPFAAGKRTLYIAIRHRQLPLDVVIEEDALAGELKQYRVLYLADRHVSQAAAEKIAAWVADGGQLFATAGAGMFDEFNRPNETLRELLGVRPGELQTPEDAVVKLSKEDLPFARPLDTVTWSSADGTATLPVISARAPFAVEGAETLGTFSDGSPAIASREVGAGRAFYVGFLSGLAYFKQAIPLRPVDRGTTNDAMDHFIPTDFHHAAGQLVGLPAAGLELPVECSEPLVATSIVESPGGVLIPLVNWTGKPISGLRVTLRADLPLENATLASGGQLSREDGAFVLDLDVADALILRR